MHFKGQFLAARCLSQSKLCPVDLLPKEAKKMAKIWQTEQ